MQQPDVVEHPPDLQQRRPRTRTGQPAGQVRRIAVALQAQARFGDAGETADELGNAGRVPRGALRARAAERAVDAFESLLEHAQRARDALGGRLVLAEHARHMCERIVRARIDGLVGVL